MSGSNPTRTTSNIYKYKSNIMTIIAIDQNVSKYLLDIIDTNDFLIITDHINDYAYMNVNQPDKLIVYKGAIHDIDLNYIVINLNNNGNHTVYSAPDIDVVNECYKLLFSIPNGLSGSVNW